MSNCTSGAHAFAAQAWVGVLKLVKGQSIVDSKRMAKINAMEVLDQLHDHEHTIQSELQKLALAVRQAHANKLTTSVNALLQQSRAKRQQLTMVSKKKKAIQKHVDTLEVSELNEKVLSSVQETAGVLKSTGLDKAVDNMDEAMADMQDSILDVNSMQETIANGMTVDDEDTDMLRAELDMLLSDDTILAPINSASSKEYTKTSSQPVLTTPPVQENSTPTDQAPGNLETIAEDEGERVEQTAV